MITQTVPDNVSPDSVQIRDLTDSLISGLLQASPGLLHARWEPEAKRVSWVLTTSTGENEFRTMKLADFRTILARIGYHYMAGFVYGGSQRSILNYRGQDYDTFFEMSNSGPSGFWIRIKTEKANHASQPTRETRVAAGRR